MHSTAGGAKYVVARSPNWVQRRCTLGSRAPRRRSVSKPRTRPKSTTAGFQADRQWRKLSNVTKLAIDSSLALSPSQRGSPDPHQLSSLDGSPAPIMNAGAVVTGEGVEEGAPAPEDPEQVSVAGPIAWTAAEGVDVMEARRVIAIFSDAAKLAKRSNGDEDLLVPSRAVSKLLLSAAQSLDLLDPSVLVATAPTASKGEVGVPMGDLVHWWFECVGPRKGESAAASAADAALTGAVDAADGVVTAK